MFLRPDHRLTAVWHLGQTEQPRPAGVQRAVSLLQRHLRRDNLTDLHKSNSNSLSSSATSYGPRLLSLNPQTDMVRCC